MMKESYNMIWHVLRTVQQMAHIDGWMIDRQTDRQKDGWIEKKEQFSATNPKPNLFSSDSVCEHAYWATVTVLIRDCSFSRYICLVARLKTCPLEFSSLTFWPWQSWQGADPSRVLHNKTFLYHVVLCKHKRAPLHPSTRLFTPVFPLQTLDRRSYFPTWSCGKS